MTKNEFIDTFADLTKLLTDQFPILEEKYQKANKSLFRKNKKKNDVYIEVINTLTDYIANFQNLANDYATCDILIENIDKDRVYFSMPIQ